ncbi:MULTISPECIES: RNA polymerase sigma-70 factor [Arenibacter]|uniref:RNA polymerase sigma-70 factor n=1 Tax=Arenibacter TaxID=178469 RepID=UPI000A39175D|nr:MULTISPECIES: RNA polymerase sigma-70 factor [Arenibacter]
MSGNEVLITPKEYRELYDSLYIPLCLFAHKYLENIEDSQDVVQDVFLKIWQKELLVKDKASAKPYLYSAVRNKCLDFLKSSYSQKREKHISVDHKQLEEESFFAREFVLVETSEIIERALNSLPTKHKNVIRFGMRGMTNQQIADRLNLSVNTIKSQKKVAYRQLRLLLEKDLLLIILMYLV